MGNEALARERMWVNGGIFFLTGDSMICLYANGTIPAGGQTVCFNLFFAILDSGRYPS